MQDVSSHIFPIHHELISRREKELLLGQHGVCLWMTGLSGSGKSTIAKELEKKLHQQGILVMVLDGDNVRAGLNSNVDFSEEGRKENIRRIAEVNKLFLSCGIVVINCFVSPTLEIRHLARTIIGSDFKEVFINTPLEECEKRDVKGLYKKARAGEIKDFTGVNAPFEPPQNADIEIKTTNKTINESTQDLYNNMILLIKPTI